MGSLATKNNGQKIKSDYGVALVCLLAALLQHFAGKATDFTVYYQAAQRFLHSGWSAIYDSGSLTPFKYTPVTVLFFVPFAMLPHAFASLLWSLLSGVSLWWVARCLGTFGVKSGEFLLALIMVVHAFTWQFKFSNVTLVMLALFVWSFTVKQEMVSGLMQSLLIALKPFWLLLPVYDLVTKKYRTFLGIFVGAFFLSAISWVIYRENFFEVHHSWNLALSDPLHAHNYPKQDNQSWFAWVYRWVPESYRTLAYLGGVALFVMAFFTAWRRKQFGWEGLPLVILWVGPLSWIHHQILLIPLFAGALPIRRNRIWLVLIWILLNGTGEGLLGREGFLWAYRAGIPLLGFIFALNLETGEKFAERT